MSRASESAAALCQPCFTRALLATIINQRQQEAVSLSSGVGLDSIAAMLSVEITSVEGVLVSSDTRRLGDSSSSRRLDTNIGIVTTYTIRVASASSPFVSIVSDTLDDLANPSANSTILSSFTSQLTT